MKKLVTQEDVSALLAAATPAAVLGAAIETGLLWTLAETPMDTASIARAFDIPARRCQVWLELLHELGLLENCAQGYAPSALAYGSILDKHSRATWQHLALDERDRSDGLHHLALYLSAPGSIWTAQRLSRPQGYVEKMRTDPERARQFTRMLYELHQKMAADFGAHLDMTGVRRLLDLGGGSGVVSMALLQMCPEATATVVDLETVCMAGREIAAERGLSNRITYLAADFVRDDLPDGFDLVVQCDVGIFAEDLHRKLWHVLNPGGRFVLAEHLSPSGRVAPDEKLRWSFLTLLDDPDFFVPTEAYLAEQLARAGFYVLSGTVTLSCGRTVIQARKEQQG